MKKKSLSKEMKLKRNGLLVLCFSIVLLLSGEAISWGQTPNAPTIGTVTQPTCTMPSGSVELTGLPEPGKWIINPGSIEDKGTSYTVTGLLPGSYTFTVTFEGYESLPSDEVVIDIQPPTPLAPFVTVVDYCNGTSALSTTAEGTLLWSTGENTATITVNVADTYTVTTTVGGCISEPGSGIAAPKTTPATPLVTVIDNCDGTSTLSTSASGSLMWSTGETTPGITVTTAGIYTVTTTVDGCISEPGSGIAAPKTTPATPLVTVIDNCDGTSTLSTTSGGSLLWSTSETTSVITVTTPGIYTVTTTIDGCTSAAGSGNAAPKTTPATPLVTVIDNCNGTSTLSTTAIGSLMWSTGETTSSITVNTAGTYTLTTTVNGCTSDAGNGTALPRTTPTAIISGSAQVCKGDTSPEITFTASMGVAPYTFTYTMNGSTRTINTASGSNTATITVSTSTATTYTYILVSVSDGNSCSQVQSGTEVVTVNPLPTATISGTTAVCQDSPSPMVTFTGASGTAPYTFLYEINSVSQPIITTPSGSNSVMVSVPTTTSGTYTYSLLSITDASSTTCSQSISGSATVTVYATPATPNVTTVTQPTCSIATGSIKLTGLPSVGTWTLTRFPGEVNTTGTGTTTTVAGLGEGTYSFTIRNSLSCTSLVSEEVVITAQPPTPTVSITNPAAVCSPATVNLTAAAVTSGSSPELIYTYWTNSSATIAYTTPTAATAGTYYIKGTNSSDCYEIKPVVVTVNQTPAANAGTGGNECDLNFTFNATASVGIGTWSLSSGPGTVLFSPNANTATATATVTSYGTYVFTWTEVNGDCSKSNSVTVNFSEQPIVTTEPGGNNCGLEFYLSATKNVGVGTWTMVSGSGTATFSPDINSPNTLVTVNTYGTYSFKWNVVNGTCSASSTVTVKFIEQPSADAGSGGDECDLSFVLKAVPGNGTTGSWKLLNGPGTAIFSPSFTNPTGTVSVSAYGNYSFAWTEANSVCKSTDIINVVFHPRPTVSAGPDMDICKGSTAQLVGTGIGTFSWQPDSLLDFPDRYNPLALPLENTTFILTLTDQYNCVNTDEIEVALWEQPIAMAGTDQVLEYLFQANLGAEPATSATGKWSVASGTGVFENSAEPVTSVTGLSLHKNELKWTVTNGVCPESSDIVLITVNDLIVPTLITPNGDPYNEYLEFKGIETLGKTELVVFDRRGTMVFENKNYNNDWNGLDKNGKELPEDTYFVILKAENGKSLSNYIVIRR